MEHQAYILITRKWGDGSIDQRNMFDEAVSLTPQDRVTHRKAVIQTFKRRLRELAESVNMQPREGEDPIS